MVIDDGVRAERAAPVGGFVARGGGDDGQAGELAGKLDDAGADAAGAVDDE